MTAEQPVGLTPRSTARGRPRTTGDLVCARCARSVAKARVRWPEGPICGICFHRATRTYGHCPGCQEHRLLPGPPNHDGVPTCVSCASIGYDFHCTNCGHEGEFYRRGICARCALRDDLTAALVTPAAAPESLARLVDALCASQRPESIFVWMRSPKVKALFAALVTGGTPLTHEGLDSHGTGHAVEHLRALLVHADALPQRDPYLARFERWLKAKLAPLPAQVAQPVEQFATWHHLKRIRAKCADGSSGRGPVHCRLPA